MPVWPVRLILALAYIIAIVAMAIFAPDWVDGQDRKSQEMSRQRAGMSLLEMIRKASPLVLLVLGGIYGGVFTPTEAGAVGALGALMIALIKRRLDRGTLWKVLVETGHIVASILMLIVAATMYSRMLAMSGLPNELGEWISHADLTPFRHERFRGDT